MKAIYSISVFVLATAIGSALALAFIIFLFESGNFSYWMETIDSNFETITTLHTFPEYWKTVKLGDMI